MKQSFSISCFAILTVWALIFLFASPGFPQRSKESARDSAPVSGFLRDVIVISQVPGVKVELRGDGLAANFQNFTLARPSRLVIDFHGVLTSFPKKFLEVDHPLLKQIRFGQYPDKLRLVLTFPTTELPPYRIVREAGGLSIIVGKIEKIPEEEKKPEAQEIREMERTQQSEGKTPSDRPPSPAAVPPEKAAEEKTVVPLPEKLEAEKPAIKAYSGEKITLDFVETDIRIVLALISETAKRQIVPSAEVQGTISLRLIDVPWDQALDVIVSIYNLKRIDEGNIIRILPREKSS